MGRRARCCRLHTAPPARLPRPPAPCHVTINPTHPPLRSPMCDRTRTSRAVSQINFIEFVVAPIYAQVRGTPACRLARANALVGVPPRLPVSLAARHPEYPFAWLRPTTHIPSRLAAVQNLPRAGGGGGSPDCESPLLAGKGHPGWQCTSGQARPANLATSLPCQLAAPVRGRRASHRTRRFRVRGAPLLHSLSGVLHSLRRARARRTS